MASFSKFALSPGENIFKKFYNKYQYHDKRDNRNVPYMVDK